MLKAIFEAIGAVFKYFTHRSQQRNKDEVVKGKKRLRESKRRDEDRRAIRERDTDEIRRRLSLLAVSLAVGLGVAACTTVVPPVNEAEEIAWDGGEQTAGLLGWTSEGWAIVTQSAVDRYQALLRKHADKVNPPVDPLQGFRLLDFEPPREDLHLMDPEVLELYLRLVYWERNE